MKKKSAHGGKKKRRGLTLPPYGKATVIRVAYRASTGDWITVPPIAVIDTSETNQVVWKAIRATTFKVTPSGGFQSVVSGPKPNTVIGTVDPSASGYYEVDIQVGKKIAIGNSSPAVIID